MPGTAGSPAAPTAEMSYFREPKPVNLYSAVSANPRTAAIGTAAPKIGDDLQMEEIFSLVSQRVLGSLQQWRYQFLADQEGIDLELNKKKGW